jgi:hypothetical protein
MSFFQHVLQETLTPADLVINLVILQLLIVKFSESVVKNRVCVYRFLNKDCTFRSAARETNFDREKQVGN